MAFTFASVVGSWNGHTAYHYIWVLTAVEKIAGNVIRQWGSGNACGQDLGDLWLYLLSMIPLSHGLEAFSDGEAFCSG
jgi:hypothetical protein